MQTRQTKTIERRLAVQRASSARRPHTNGRLEASNQVPLAALTRRQLAFSITALVVCIVASALYQPTAIPVLDKILPVLLLVLGYYFGQK